MISLIACARAFVSSIKITGCVDEGKVCRFCGLGHNEEIINRELKRFRGAELLIPASQKEVLHVTRAFCEEHDFELEVIDISELSFLDKMKLVSRRIRAPASLYQGRKVKGTPTVEKLRALSRDKGLSPIPIS
jgi:hypothetical protein